MGKFGILGSFQASLPPQKRPKNQNEVIFLNLPPRNIPMNNAGKPNGIITIPLGNHTDRPGNLKNWRIWDVKASYKHLGDLQRHHTHRNN